MRPFIFQETEAGSRTVASGTTTELDHALALRFVADLSLVAMRAGSTRLSVVQQPPIVGAEEGFVELTARYPR